MDSLPKEQYLSTIKESISALMCLPNEKDCCEIFMSGYNAVYKYCTEKTKEKYIIEGAEVYQIYDQILIKYLKRLPVDYTLETFVRFVDGYIRANERICKMLSFLSRYFVRVNLEISNTNVMELKRLYFERLFSVLIAGNENTLHTLFIEELKSYVEMRVQKTADKSVYYRNLKILRVMVRAYIKVCEISSQKKSLKKLLNAMAKFIACVKEDRTDRFLYYRIAAVDSLFKKKEKNKRHLYRMVEEKVDDKVLIGFIEGFVTKMMRTGINRRTHAEVSPFYSFIDNSVKAKTIFINATLLMCVRIIEKTADCSSILRFSIFMGRHFNYIPRTSKLVKRVFEMVVLRRLRTIVNEEWTVENQLLESINSHMTAKKQPIVELSLIIANIPSHKPVFWKKFLTGIKNRLILGSSSGCERKLINIITKRIEQYKEPQLKQDAQIFKKIFEYIDKDTLYNLHEYYDSSNFEEILLCIKDIATSEIYFRTTKPELETKCFLLAYTRWNYPVVNMHIPAELEEMWDAVKQYCVEKGRKFILRFCPTVSSITLEINDIEIECDIIQGSILILLARNGPHTLDSLVETLIVDVTEKTRSLMEEKVKGLLDLSLLEENNGKYEISLGAIKESINIFVPEIEDVLNEKESVKYTYSKGAVEACIVKTLKKERGMTVEALKETVSKIFPLEDRELEMHIMTLHEKGIVSISGEILYFVP